MNIMSNVAQLTVSFFFSDTISDDIANFLIELSTLYKLSGGSKPGYAHTSHPLPKGVASKTDNEPKTVLSVRLTPINQPGRQFVKPS